MKRVLISGGAGFIGSHLAIRMLQKGWQVRVLDNLSEQIHGSDPSSTSPLFASILGKVEFMHGSVTSRDDWARALADQDVVVHLAAETGTGQSMYLIEKYVDVNVRGTSIMLDILANVASTVRKVVVASSRAIYGEGKYLSEERGVVYPLQRSEADMKAGRFEVTDAGCSALKLMPTDEESRIHPSSIYGITKQVQEQLVMTSCRACGIPAVSFRYQNVYGPGQSLSNPYTGILSIFSSRILAGLPINVFEDGLASRDFVYISDVVAATLAGIESPAADHQVFNVGSGQQTTVLQVANELAKLFGRDVPITVSGMFRVGDIRHNIADLTHLRRTLGFHPQVPFTDGLARFVAWVQQQNAQTGDYERSLREMQERGLLRGG
ncbi:MAG: NAD-dependent epimerase/dehydratase family protein [Burkholderiaceae bacterium]|nr:NAD-dependent epimerase/dehydratase family protein [Burkholderiaceae bacterium]